MLSSQWARAASKSILLNAAKMTKKATEKVPQAAEEALAPEQNPNEEIVIESRFGTIKSQASHAVYFPRGLLGLPAELHFVITEIPQQNMSRFRLLQCLNDHSISFVILPLDFVNPLIERADMEECCKLVEVEPQNLLTLLIVSVHRLPGDIKVTANVRAPVVIDISKRLGIQYVFPTNKYDIRQPLS